MCYRRSLHGIPRSSLAEAAQASMKATGGKNLSLIDAVYASVTDSVRLEAKIQNRENGEVVRGTGPSESEVQKRSERRQILRAEQMVESRAISGEDLLFNDTIFDVTRSHRPDKRHCSLNISNISAKRRRSIETNQFSKVTRRFCAAAKKN